MKNELDTAKEIVFQVEKEPSVNTLKRISTNSTRKEKYKRGKVKDKFNDVNAVSIAM